MENLGRILKFGKTVRENRLRLGWTQEELALKLGVDAAYISRIELGRKNPSLDTVLRFASAFGINVLFGDKRL